jgi:hypothetical protein
VKTKRVASIAMWRSVSEVFGVSVESRRATGNTSEIMRQIILKTTSRGTYSKQSRREAGGPGEYRCIAGVKSRAEEKDRSDAADDLGEVSGFVLMQRAA